MIVCVMKDFVGFDFLYLLDLIECDLKDVLLWLQWVMNEIFVNIGIFYFEFCIRVFEIGEWLQVFVDYLIVFGCILFFVLLWIGEIVCCCEG